MENENNEFKFIDEIIGIIRSGLSNEEIKEKLSL